DVKAELLVQVVLFDVRQEIDKDAQAVHVRVHDHVEGEPLVGIFVVVHGQADLLEVVLALRACGGVADLLYRGQEQPDEDGDDGHHYKQLDEGEPLTGTT